MKNKKILRAIAIGLAVAAFGLTGCNSGGSSGGSQPSAAAASAAPAASNAPAQAAPVTQSDYPNREITVVVPWNPGGGTDLTVRTLVEEMAGDLGKRMTVNNMPGASGSVGMQDVYDSAKDGYKILGHGMMAFTNSQVMGLTDTSYTEWVVWDAAFAPNVIAVRKESPYQTIEDLIQAMKDNPGQITVSSAGVGSGGHIGATVFAEGIGATFDHITYEGGNPAIIGALGGEVDFTAQLSNEMIDMLRSGDMRGLASLNDQDLVLKGSDGSTITIPSIKTAVPDLANLLPVGESFGILVPKGTPDDVVTKIDAAYKKAVQSDSFKSFVEEKGMVLFAYDNAKTAEYLDKLASIVCWTLYDVGSAKLSPDTVGIPRLN